MTKVLITGAAGFIGRNLVESFTDRYALSAPTKAELDLCAEHRVRDFLRQNHFDAVVHCATTRSNRKIGAPPDLFERNCRMFFNLARNRYLFGRMLFLNSGAVYDQRNLPPRVAESYFDTHVPADPYGFSKYVCSKYAETTDNIFDLRLFGVFGKYEAWEVRFISSACCRVIHGLPILVRQNARLDYLHVSDLANLIRWFIEHDPKRMTYNLCTGTAYELKTLAETVAAASGKDPAITVKNEGMGAEYSGDNSLLVQEIGAYKFRDMRCCIRELYGWYDAHKDSIARENLRFDE